MIQDLQTLKYRPLKQGNPLQQHITPLLQCSALKNLKAGEKILFQNRTQQFTHQPCSSQSVFGSVVGQRTPSLQNGANHTHTLTVFWRTMQWRILRFSALLQNTSQQNGASFSKSHKDTLSMELWRNTTSGFLLLSLACKLPIYKTKLACWRDYINTQKHSFINSDTLLELIKSEFAFLSLCLWSFRYTFHKNLSKPLPKRGFCWVRP